MNIRPIPVLSVAYDFFVSCYNCVATDILVHGELIILRHFEEYRSPSTFNFQMQEREHTGKLKITMRVRIYSIGDGIYPILFKHGFYLV